MARTTLSVWVKAEINGTLTSRTVSGRQTESNQLQQELARVTLERDLLIRIVVRLVRPPA